MTVRSHNNRSKASYNNKVHHILDTVIKQRNLKQIDICRHLGVSGTTYLRIKRDYRNNLSLNKLYALAGILCVSALQLLYILERGKQMDEVDTISLNNDIDDTSDITDMYSKQV